MRALSAGALLTIGLLFARGVCAQQEPTPKPLRIHMAEGDLELLSRIAAESSVVTRSPRSGAMDYLAAVVERILEWMMGLLRPLGRYTEGLGPLLEAATRILTVLAAALLLYLSGRWLVRRSQKSRTPDAAVLVEEDTRPKTPLWSSAEWRREIQNRLDCSDVAGSLEALWWWLARSVEGLSVRDSWTSGDLLASARRPALRAPVRRLERMMYGSRKPSVNEVRELLDALEQQLA